MTSSIKEFKVNDYISVKLQNDHTVIYLDGKKFMQCSYLLIHKPSKIEGMGVINSIDEAADLLDKRLEHRDDKEEIEISPEEEFWGHCSNLQAWAENGYDTRLIHSNLAIPLLKKLTDIGDSKAKLVFKEEIARRIINVSEYNMIWYFFDEGYLDYLDDEERNSLFRELFIKATNDASLKFLDLLFANSVFNSLNTEERDYLFDRLIERINLGHFELKNQTLFEILEIETRTEFREQRIKIKELIKEKIIRHSNQLGNMLSEYLVFFSGDELEKMLWQTNFNKLYESDSEIRRIFNKNLKLIKKLKNINPKKYEFEKKFFFEALIRSYFKGKDTMLEDLEIILKYLQ
ncbi:MAG: hypothetical protein GF353_23695 [Candidatus Lokiarchaeota archaeon]|nr:hypothetical protein [Candidatus Lokiarchaeota archaeon]